MIKVQGLHYRYEDGTVALKDINMNIEKENIIGIVGANGCGKSTLFFNLMGLYKPYTGKIFLGGQEIKYHKKALKEVRKKIGMVFQDPDKQIFYSKVYDDVAFGPRNLNLEEKEVEQRVEKALAMVDMLDCKEKPVHFLSYGQKKKITIAGTLAMENNILLLDEPTAGLDPMGTDMITDIIRRLAKEGKKIVISSHDMDMMYDLCDYVYVMAKGEIIHSGTSKEVFTKEDILKQAKLKPPWIVKLRKEYTKDL